jgi:hypothetical protein
LAIQAPAPDERRQFRLLFRTFLRGLFENDLVPDTVDLRQSVLSLAAIFIVPPFLIAVALVTQFGPWMTPAEVAVASLSHKLFFVGYSMAAVGLLTVLVWDALFPDRRDLMVLGTLPIRGRTVVAAKLSALVAFVGGFALAVNVPTTLVVSFAVGGFSTLGTFLRYPFGHLTATVLAGMFVFLSLLALQTTLALVLPRRALHALAVAAQLVFVIVVVEWFVYSPGLIARWMEVDPGVTAASSAAATDMYGALGGVLSHCLGRWLPPVWFLGLYEVVLGVDATAFGALAATAFGAFVLAFAIAGLAYGASLRRIVRHTMETPQMAAPGRGGVLRAVSRVVGATVLRHPVELAVVTFGAKSLARSRRHRLMIAIYVGVALAFVIGGFLGPFIQDRVTDVSFTEPTTTLLSIPFLLSFFVLVALRVVFAVPTEHRANWIFQLTESGDTVRYLSGARKTMWLLGVMPIALITLPMYGALWGLGVALAHTVFWLLLAALLAEVLLHGFRKVPFTCSYVPGTRNLMRLWPVYLVAMTTYGYSTARLEMWLLADTLRLFVACAGIAVVLLARVQRPGVHSDTLIYDESVQPTIQTLGIMPDV